MKKIGIITLIVSLLFISGCSNENRANSGIQKITGDQLYQQIRENHSMLIIDVRSKEEYSQGHIEDAINIPVDEMNEKTMKPYKKQAKIIVYCRSGVRSSQAAKILENLKFKNIYDLGGIDDNWEYSLVKDVTNRSQ